MPNPNGTPENLVAALTEARRPKQAPPDRTVDYGPRPCLIDV
jgi:hypothetical protein